MQTSETTWRTSQDEVLRHRIAVLLLRAAAHIEVEDPATEEHRVRLTLVDAVRRSPAQVASLVQRSVADNPTVRSAVQVTEAGVDTSLIPDADLEYLVAALWTRIAWARLERLAALNIPVEV